MSDLKQIREITLMNLQSIPQRWGQIGAFVTCLEWHVAPMSARPRMAGPDCTTMDGSAECRRTFHL